MEPVDRWRDHADELLVEHCFALDLRPPRPPARDRLELALGTDLAARLVAALAPRRAVA